MGLAEALAVLLVVAVVAALLAGYPVAFTLAGISLAFAALAHTLDLMSFGFLGALPQRITGIMTNEVLLAIPLFVFMGVILERSRIAEDLLDNMGRLFGGLRGGLGLAVIVVGTLLAAAKGVVGATAVAMGLITLPAMLRHGYDKRLAAGTIAATATLAQIMPPATVLVMLGDQLNTAYQSAQLSRGTFSPESVSVADLFAGAMLPALLLVALYMAFVLLVAWLRPDLAPAMRTDDAPAGEDRATLRRRTLETLVAPVLLIVAVLGSILAGIATATESAAVGAFGAMLLTARKLDPTRGWPVSAVFVAVVLLLALRRLADLRPGTDGASVAMLVAIALVAIIVFGTAVTLVRLARDGVLGNSVARTAQITTMIFTILIGATLFSLVFRGLGGDEMVARALADLPGGVHGAVAIVMLAIFLLGFVMDAFEIIFVVVPIVGPALLRLEGVDPVWLGIMIAMNLQTSYMHPPLGPTLFFLRGVAPPEVTTRHIYVGIIPFVAIQLLALALLWSAPQLATVLPQMLK